MAIGGAFLGGGVEVVPAGSCKLELEILTEDRANLTATFTIKGTSTYTVTAGADGRAVYTVPAGQTYTVSVNATGYDNLASQTVIAESGTVRYVRFEAFAGRVKRSGDTMTGTLAFAGGASIDTNGQVIGKKLRATADIHLGSSPSSYAVINDGWIQNRTIDETKSDLGITSKQDRLTAGTNITISGTTISAKDTTYDVATQSANGLMSSTDKTKLDGVDSALAGKVSKSGDTMTGILSITSTSGTPRLYLKHPSLDITTTPSSNCFLDQEYLDKNGKRFALIEGLAGSNSSTRQIGLMINSSNGSGSDSWSRLQLTHDGTAAYATAPSWSVGTNDNSDKILTIKMANSLPSLMHTTGNESISGQKTFTGELVSKGGFEIVSPLPYIDFHHGESTQDYTSRFINGADGVFTIDVKTDDLSKMVYMNFIANDGVIVIPSTPSHVTGNQIATADWALSKFQRKITYGTGDPPSGGQAGDIYIKI